MKVPREATRKRKRKNCTFLNCLSNARDATGLCCRHKGGQRCQYVNINGDKCGKGAARAIGLCISHGGGKQCQFVNDNGDKCKTGAMRATDYCKTHGGGKRCQFVNDNGDKCKTGAEGATGLCVAHGGGYRCQYVDISGDNCPTGAVGATGFCVSHGGGKRCKFVTDNGNKCKTGAIRSTGFCITHGGGKRCTFPNCTSSAAGATNFCIAHKGGRRCPNCVDWIDSRCGQKKFDGYCATCYYRLFQNTQRPGVRNYKTKELAVLCHLEQHFPKHHIVNDRRISGGCSKKKPDFFFELLTHVIIVEVDEHGHMPYDKSCENKRMMELSEDIAHRPLVFIRFNPDKTSSEPGCWGYDETGRAVVKKKRAIEWQERLAALTAKITFWLTTIPDKTVELIKLYY